MRTVRKATVYKRWNGGLGLCGTCLGLLSDTCQSPPSHTVREMNTTIEIPQTDILLEASSFLWQALEDDQKSVILRMEPRAVRNYVIFFQVFMDQA